MRTDPHPTTAKAIAISWLTAAAALGTAFVLAVLGQGLGSMAGGCRWIGATLPMDRQVWALVNQPVLNFSSLPKAGGYWLGSMILPMVAAVFLLLWRTRKPTLIGQLAIVQIAWWVAMVTGIWLPLLDRSDGHVARWLTLHEFPAYFVWAAPFAAAGVALWAGYRCLEIARGLHRDPGRGRRLAIVFLELILPVAVWQLASALLYGGPPIRPVLGLGAAAAAVTALAFFGYPPPYPRPLRAPTFTGVATLVAAALVTISITWVAGRPLGDGRVSGVLWAAPESFNNIRPWVKPVALSDRTTVPEARKEKIPDRVILIANAPSPRASGKRTITRESIS